MPRPRPVEELSATTCAAVTAGCLLLAGVVVASWPGDVLGTLLLLSLLANAGTFATGLRAALRRRRSSAADEAQGNGR